MASQTKYTATDSEVAEITFRGILSFGILFRYTFMLFDDISSAVLGMKMLTPSL